MALSSGGRKLFAEVAGFVGVLALGAVMLTHRPQTEALVESTLGIHFPRPVEPAPTEAKTDDGDVRTNRGRSVELTAATNGHFFAEAEINGRSVKVMVDTGAGMVAMTYNDARGAGFSLRDSDFTLRTTTANGVGRAAPVVIDRLTIGDIEVRNVKAAVMEDGKLETTLLGMTFLSRLGTVAMKSGRLVLEE